MSSDKSTDLSVPVESSANEVDQEHELPAYSSGRLVAVVLLCTSVMILNIMSVQAMTLALPTVQRELNIEQHTLQWVVTCYSLTFSCFLLLFGRLADLYGPRLVFVLGSIMFAVWSLACGFAQTYIQLFFFRAFQGIGAAATVPAGLAILGRTFKPGPGKSAAFATFSCGAPVGASLGLVFGGVLTTYTKPTWRTWLYVGGALSFAVAGFAPFVIPSDKLLVVRTKDRSVDWLGAWLATSGLVLLTFSLADGSGAPNGWRTPYIPTLFSLSIVLLVAFWFWQRYLEYSPNSTMTPLMRVSLWKRGRFAVVMLISFLAYACFSSYSYFATLFYQDYIGLSAVLTTVRFLPMSITGVLINFTVAIVVAYVPAQYLIMLGCLGTAIAPMLFALQKIGDPYWQWQFPAMILTVFGADLIFACGTIYASKVADARDQGLAGGIINTVLQVATGTAIAIFTIIQDETQSRDARRQGVIVDQDQTNLPASSLLVGLRAAFWGCAAFSFAGFALSAIFLRSIGTVGEKSTVKAIASDEESATSSKQQTGSNSHDDKPSNEAQLHKEDQAAAVDEKATL
ncbi:uncharacterized protein L969DRAFT_91610 [Mixia osmundae IAM 14324]|uniref:Major facilitator superfamily (MFS) profile domain-containing protein n=1 Tax=Mixia osmundae (strain CBS 9802 / IAM 14324 / JCM 22182 / KY 12970) TaxID=764103 RepID=G7DZZ4_MIXOS|nr:uncharacterized protein L969DRAFT_91610 [Mixia osmundae IAM 14324]KEI42146.1 hypothetical protein L969DRAFT_91610 [Mixia osmundae IAM 14324]GAA96154.1 hypothetical protein E5Q_02815 [Mixia osmundae IAM 14324]